MSFFTASLIIMGAVGIVLWLRFIIVSNIRDEAAIRSYEKRTGISWLREGKINKGGRNPPSTIARPPPPPKY